MNTTRPPPSAPHGHTTRALVVEDDAAVARIIQRLLALEGWEVEVAATGDLALEALLRAPFDLVVSDLHLPGASGLDLLATIRAYDLGVPVVLVTGAPSLETAVQALNLGAQQYLQKPFSNDELVTACRRAYGLASHRLQARRVHSASDGAALALDHALESMWVAFQPIVRNRAVVAYEALLRSDESSLPNPAAILGAAAAAGRLHEVGRRVRSEVADAIGRAPAKADIFVNLHSADLLDDELYAATSALSGHAARVVFELTERADLERIDRFVARIGMLRVLGYRLALDDLGAGHAGLGAFAQLEPEFVKLDMSLVRNVHQNAVKRRLVSAIASVAEELDVELVAEGVESEDEYHCVTRLGCALAQGHLFARPERDFVDSVPAP